MNETSVKEVTYSVENGDRGSVTLDGVEVKAVACCPVAGWVECHVKANGEVVGLCEPSEFHNGIHAMRLGLQDTVMRGVRKCVVTFSRIL